MGDQKMMRKFILFVLLASGCHDERSSNGTNEDKSIESQDETLKKSLVKHGLLRHCPIGGTPIMLLSLEAGESRVVQIDRDNLKELGVVVKNGLQLIDHYPPGKEVLEFSDIRNPAKNFRTSYSSFLSYTESGFVVGEYRLENHSGELVVVMVYGK